MGLQQFERRLERLVEGVFARAFRSGLQPVELGRRLTREMDLKRTVAPRGTLTPNAFTVGVSPEDRRRFEPFEGELVAELVSCVRDHARSERYLLVGPVAVELWTDEALAPGLLSIAGQITAGDGSATVLVLDDGTRIPVGVEPVTVGRLPGCTVVVSDPNVSRRHAEVRADPESGGHVVSDLESTNGTKVNGVKVTAQRLKDGDEITVGSTRLRYEAG